MAIREQTKCDECKKKNCPQRLEGAVCSLNSQIVPLVDATKSRDPQLISRFIISIIGSEYERYVKAKDAEDIGAIVEKTITHKNGTEYTVNETRTVDNNVTSLALNLIKAGKMLSDILNPPKSVPFFQQNIQNNINVSAADEIRSLPEEEKDKVLNFIDDKLDVARQN